MGKRVLVCGGRGYADRDFLAEVLDRIHAVDPIEAIIHGNANGADSLAGWWADLRGVKNIPHPADWKKHGKAAGPIRNQEMIDISEPTVVLAFPGGRGTADMIRRARKAGVPVISAAPRTGHTGDAK